MASNFSQTTVWVNPSNPTFVQSGLVGLFVVIRERIHSCHRCDNTSGADRCYASVLI
jgi:hypothetical protein